MQAPMRVAALQLSNTPDRERNIQRAFALVDAAIGAGARCIMTPENTDAIAPRAERLAMAEPVDGPWIQRWRAKARETACWILIGSFGERSAVEGRVHNTSVMIAPDGRLAATYRKIHLFDADPPDGVPYRESESVLAGTSPVSVDLPFGRAGLSICYDVRFPELYRALSADGACVLTVPSAFTVPTGQAHWEPLLRARAIENLSYVFAPAQVGEHFPGRRSYGHTLIVSPWGELLADAGASDEGFVSAEVDPSFITKVRAMIPALSHRRL